MNMRFLMPTLRKRIGVNSLLIVTLSHYLYSWRPLVGPGIQEMSATLEHATILCSGFSDEQPMMCRDDYRIATCLKDEQAHKEAENRYEDAGKKCRPESRYLEARNNR